ncbi:vacuolar protein sorting-associated protein 29-like isoform X2 [Schistocerca gregaria]|uniref:vacuolar protein sorting-associated protein 29-like isoform X2 n=1 Tax=Schistocerca gregaria TaxID=7010 RepID=UPI00211E259D|nr:vacuolar protein sorting-associated protein 29-like isoform X2 [Schistocerca gregaria]
MLVLIAGDLHIPHRTSCIPAQFRKLLAPNKVQHTLITGNLCLKEQYEYFFSLCNDVHVVKGDFDEENYPTEKVINIGGYKIGLIHGHQIVPFGDKEAFLAVQRRLDTDILVSGHTHQMSSWEDQGKLFLNPGSITGAYTGFTAQVVPSFMLLDITESGICVYMYELKENMSINRIYFGGPSTKPSSSLDTPNEEKCED